MTLAKITTVQALKALFAACCIGPQTPQAAAVPNLRSDKISSEDYKTLSEYITDDAGYVQQVWVDPNIEGILEELLGLEPATPTDIIFLTIGKDSYTAKRNQKNRKRTLSRIGPTTKDGTYSNLMVRGRWASLPIDSHAYDWYGQIQTAQHRFDAMLAARKAGAVLPLIHVTVGLPPQFKDLTDKAKARTKIDDSFTDESLLPIELVTLVQLNSSGVVTELQSRLDERKKLVEMHSKVCSGIAHRLTGKDVPPSGGKQSWNDESDLAERFGSVSFDDFVTIVKDEHGNETATLTQEGGEFSALGKLVCEVFEAAKSQGGKLDMPWTKAFNPSVVAIGLVLASNDQAYIDGQIDADVVKQPGETIEDFAERKLAFRSRLLSPESELRIDWNLVATVLKMLRESMPNVGELGTVFAELFRSIDKDKKSTENAKHLYKPMSIAAMSAFVALVNGIRSGDLDSNIFTVYKKLPGTSDYSPSYRCFGGRDCGYVQTRKSKTANE